VFTADWIKKRMFSSIEALGAGGVKLSAMIEDLAQVFTNRITSKDTCSPEKVVIIVFTMGTLYTRVRRYVCTQAHSGQQQSKL
jgi:hypothetical protein